MQNACRRRLLYERCVGMPLGLCIAKLTNLLTVLHHIGDDIDLSRNILILARALRVVKQFVRRVFQFAEIAREIEQLQIGKCLPVVD